MMQIIFSLRVALTIYWYLFGMHYYGTMQILSIFIILGIGADDIFVLADAWKQSAADVPKIPASEGQAYEIDWFKARLRYAYVRDGDRQRGRAAHHDVWRVLGRVRRRQLLLRHLAHAADARDRGAAPPALQARGPHQVLLAHHVHGLLRLLLVLPRVDLRVGRRRAALGDAEIARRQRARGRGGGPHAARGEEVHRGDREAGRRAGAHRRVRGLGGHHGVAREHARAAARAGEMA